MSNQLSSLFFVFVSKEELESIKKEHQEHLLNTKYLRSHILLVSKEDLESIKKGHKRYFQNKEKEILLIGESTFPKNKSGPLCIYGNHFRPKSQ